MERIRRNILTGLLTVIPLWITVWATWFVVDLLIHAGRPIVIALARGLRPTNPDLADVLTAPWFRSAIAFALVLLALYILGAAANAVVGRRIFRFLDGIVHRVPLASTIYRALRTLVDSLQAGPQGGQRVVLIEFPTPEMRAVGFVTRTFIAADTREEVAAVYVPTTPNPTSGYVEIVPTARLVWLDWTVNDAMSFIVSGGALAPAEICMNPGATRAGAANVRHGRSEGVNSI